MTLLVLQ